MNGNVHQVEAGERYTDDRGNDSAGTSGWQKAGT